MQYTISNEELSLTVDTKAAEMHSLKRNDDAYEYLWQGDPKFWAGRNPTLFPQISSTSTKTHVLYGKEYKMGNHGFTRGSEFELVEKKDDSLTLLLKDNEETRSQYPFSFNLFINYKLDKGTVTVSYKIVNLSKEVMPFGFGLHPAFNCKEGYENTTITMDEKEVLEISEELFKKYPTYMYSPSKFTSAVLRSNGYGLKLDFKGYDILAIWSPFAPFVCIEPWTVLQPKNDVAFEDREGYIKLKENEIFEISYSISPLGKLD